MRGLFSRVAWRLWRRRHAHRIRLHRQGGLSFEGVYWYRDHTDLHLLKAGVYDAEERLQPAGGEAGHVWIPLGAIIFQESA